MDLKWCKIENGDPGFSGSDRHYMVVLHNKFVTVAFFFRDSFGPWWSDQWDVYDKRYSDNEVTHWAEMPELPK